jgi:hypothetical protein
LLLLVAVPAVCRVTLPEAVAVRAVTELPMAHPVVAEAQNHQLLQLLEQTTR